VSVISKLRNPLRESYQTFKELVNGQEFPWYYYEHSVEGKNDDFDNLPFYGHTILARPGYGDALYSTPMSPYIELANLVLSDIFEYNNIDVNVVHRINVNCTHWSSDLPSVPHVDHDFPHKNLVVYLSGFDFGETCLWKDGKCVSRYIPVEDGIITFEGLHNIEQPRVGCRRIVLVATYS